MSSPRSSTRSWAALASHRAAVLGVLGLGLLLRLAHYAYGRALWRDEGSLVASLKALGWSGLTGPLFYDNEAPVGFLWAQKAIIVLAGDSELALRLLPLLAGLASVPLFFLLARRFLEPPAALLALFLFATSLSGVYYAAETKPYAIELALALALLLLTLRGLDGDAPRGIGLAIGVVGAVGLWFSFQSVFLLAGAGAAFAIRGWQRRDPAWFKAAGVLAAISVASAALLFLLSLRRVIANRTMQSLWAEHFFPVIPHGLSQLIWLPRHLHSLFRMPFDLPIPVSIVATLLFCVGAFAMWRRRDHRWIVLLAPALFALAGSAIRVYPFHGRHLLFLLPALIILVAYGLEALSKLGWRLAPPMAVALGLALAAAAGYALASQLPALLEREDIRPLLARIEQQRQDGDRIYVYRGGEKTFPYYAPRYRLGPADSVVMGGRDPTEVRRLAGAKRVWVVVVAIPDRSIDTWASFAAVFDEMGTCATQIVKETVSLLECDLSGR